MVDSDLPSSWKRLLNDGKNLVLLVPSHVLELIGDAEHGEELLAAVTEKGYAARLDARPHSRDATSMGRVGDPGRKVLAELAQGFRARTLVTAKLAARAGFKILRKTVDPDGTFSHVDIEKTLVAARELTATLGDLKGLVMKLGQMASYLDGALPPEAQRVLADLQAKTTPMNLRAVRRVVEEDLGAPIGELFERFDAEAFAAASIGQVHRARYAGRELAVKVQYPGIVDALHSDLRTIGAFARLTTIVSPVDGGALAEELRERILEECDYVAEAANLRLFRRLLSAVPRASVPGVVDERSTRRVLACDYVDATSFYDFCREATQADKNRAAATIFDAAMTCIFRYCAFNADPHPGNYLFRGSGEVTFLDFGCIKRFSRHFVEAWKALALTVLNGKRSAFPDAYVAAGLAKRARGIDWDYQWQMMQHIYEPYLAPGFTFTGDYVRRSYDVIMWRNPNKLRLPLPRDWLFVNRLQWGLYSVMSLLGASAPWAELWRRAVESPTEPAEAAAQ